MGGPIAKKQGLNKGEPETDELMTAVLEETAMKTKILKRLNKEVYNLGPKPGLPNGLDPANAMIYYTAHPRDSELSDYYAEHCRWAARETLKALKLSADDAVAASEAAGRANTAALGALRQPAAQFPRYEERPMAGEPWAVLKGAPTKHGFNIQNPENVDLRKVMKWFEKHPGPPPVPMTPRIVINHGSMDNYYTKWRANQGNPKAVLEMEDYRKDQRRQAQKAAHLKAIGISTPEKEERYTPTPDVPIQPPIPFLYSPSSIIPMDGNGSANDGAVSAVAAALGCTRHPAQMAGQKRTMRTRGQIGRAHV